MRGLPLWSCGVTSLDYIDLPAYIIDRLSFVTCLMPWKRSMTTTLACSYSEKRVCGRSSTSVWRIWKSLHKIIAITATDCLKIMTVGTKFCDNSSSRCLNMQGWISDFVWRKLVMVLHGISASDAFALFQHLSYDLKQVQVYMRASSIKALTVCHLNPI